MKEWLTIYTFVSEQTNMKWWQIQRDHASDLTVNGSSFTLGVGTES